MVQPDIISRTSSTRSTNNSETVQYVDGLGIGNILPMMASTATYNWEMP